MGWSSDGYSYTKEEIGPSAYSAGCGNGWLWMHKRPNMFIRGYINDDGAYEITFYKPNTSAFPYTLNLKINGKEMFNFNTTALNNKTNKATARGSLAGAQTASVLLICGAPVCDVGATGAGKVIIFTDLYPYVGIFHNNQWHKAYAYVFTAGQWKLMKFTIYNGQWKRPISI